MTRLCHRYLITTFSGCYLCTKSTDAYLILIFSYFQLLVLASSLIIPYRSGPSLDIPLVTFRHVWIHDKLSSTFIQEKITNSISIIKNKWKAVPQARRLFVMSDINVHSVRPTVCLSNKSDERNWWRDGQTARGRHGVQETDCFDLVLWSWLAHMGELFFKACGLSALFVLKLLPLLSHTINKQLLSVVYILYAITSPVVWEHYFALQLQKTESAADLNVVAKKSEWIATL